MRPRFALPIGLGLVGLAFVGALATPGDDLAEAPFASTGRLGDEITSQHHVVTFRDAALADMVELGGWRGTTAGMWFVVEATLAARVERTGADVDLFVDGVRYQSSARADSDTVDGSVVDPGLPQTGPVLIEVPADILDRPGARAAVLRLSASGDTRLDSAVEIPIDLTALERRDRLELDRTRDGVR